MIDIYDNKLLGWSHDGQEYCLHVLVEPYPEDPRKVNENIATMACFHPRYNLGDFEHKRSDNPASVFWRSVVRDNISEEEFWDKLVAGKISGVRAQKCIDGENVFDIYETTSISSIFGDSEPEETLEYGGIVPGAAIYHVLEDMDAKHCIALLSDKIEVMDMWLYDHSGISVSCGKRTYPYNDRWDSMGIGWIFVLKDDLLKEGIAAEDNWRKKAVEIMNEETKTYNEFLTGNVFSYNLYEKNGGNWEEVDDVFCIYGSELDENDVGYGFAEALAENRVKEGEAKIISTRTYCFDI